MLTGICYKQSFYKGRLFAIKEERTKMGIVVQKFGGSSVASVLDY